jgi:hypothetical protein
VEVYQEHIVYSTTELHRGAHSFLKSSCRQEIPHILRNQEFHYTVNKSPPLFSKLIQYNPVKVFQPIPLIWFVSFTNFNAQFYIH